MKPRLPRLLAIAGPLDGAGFALTAAETWIGRDATNEICLADLRASRRHCVLTRAGDEIRLRDNDSSNGTLVNDKPVRECVLQPHDRVQIGHTLFLYLLEAEETPTRPSIPFALEESAARRRATITLRQDEAVYLHPEKVSALPASERLTRDLNALLNLSTAISKIRELRALQHQLLELALAVIPRAIRRVAARPRTVRASRPHRVARP